jgi:aldehyde dehydrogenase (NAD+)
MSPDEMLQSLNPATGDVVGAHRIDDADSVNAAVARARDASVWWAGLGFDGRGEVLGQWRSVLTRRMAQLADVVHQETGKPHGDAQLEIGLALDHLAWVGSHAERCWGRKRVSPGLLLANQTASVEYLPFGVIGVIGPWNYPVFTPMGSIAYALGAGNAVVFKPSELTPGVGVWLADSLREVVPDRDLFQVVIGSGATGAALCRADIGKLAFTGSTATGKKVMATCAEKLTPVLIERVARTRCWSTRTPTSSLPRTRPPGVRSPTPGRPASASSGSTCTTRCTTGSSRSSRAEPARSTPGPMRPPSSGR